MNLKFDSSAIFQFPFLLMLLKVSGDYPSMHCMRGEVHLVKLPVYHLMSPSNIFLLQSFLQNECSIQNESGSDLK